MTLGPILTIIARLLGIAERRNEDKNAADVKERKKRQDEVDAQARETKAVAEEDVDASRRNWSE